MMNFSANIHFILVCLYLYQQWISLVVNHKQSTISYSIILPSYKITNHHQPWYADLQCILTSSLVCLMLLPFILSHLEIVSGQTFRTFYHLYARYPAKQHRMVSHICPYCIQHHWLLITQTCSSTDIGDSQERKLEESSLIRTIK